MTTLPPTSSYAPVRSASRRPWVILAIVVTLVAGGTVAAFLLFGGRGPTPVAVPATSVPATTPVPDTSAPVTTSPAPADAATPAPAAPPVTVTVGEDEPSSSPPPATTPEADPGECRHTRADGQVVGLTPGSSDGGPGPTCDMMRAAVDEIDAGRVNPGGITGNGWICPGLWAGDELFCMLSDTSMELTAVPIGDPTSTSSTSSSGGGGGGGGGGGNSPATTSTVAPVTGDLGLAVPMVVPPCDGTPAVIFASAITPAAYATDVRNALNAWPGSSYVRTDQACTSLRQSLNGNAIYAVYQLFESEQQACAVINAHPGAELSARRLENSGSPEASTFSC